MSAQDDYYLLFKQFRAYQRQVGEHVCTECNDTALSFMLEKDYPSADHLEHLQRLMVAAQAVIEQAYGTPLEVAFTDLKAAVEWKPDA